MINHPMSAMNFRVLLPETLWLEPEYFEQARELSKSLDDEIQRWQVYLNTLAMLALEGWFQERLPIQPVERSLNKVADATYLKVGEFVLCLIATEHVLSEVVYLPRVAIEQPELSAHFYVLLEVMEEQGQVIIRGLLRYDELRAYYDRLLSPASQSELCPIPLSAFDAEINHLVFYIQHSQPNTISLPVVAPQSIATSAQTARSPVRTRLSQWLEGILDEGWQTIDALINPEANLVWSTRQTSLGTKSGKLINFGVQLDNQTVALLVTVMPESEDKIGISIQVLPVGGAQFLPAQLKLTLLSGTDKILQEVQSREQDNYIQLKPFRGKPGVNFSIEVSLNNVQIREVFEL